MTREMIAPQSPPWVTGGLRQSLGGRRGEVLPYSL